jgi:hypothetical protein
MNLLIALSTQGLIGAAFPTTGIPEIPKPRLTHGAAFPTTGTPEIHKSRLTHVDPAVLIVRGNGSGMNTGASLKAAGGVDEKMSRHWSGTLTWQGTDATSNERKEMCAQVTATTSEGNPYAFMEFLFIDDLCSRSYPDWHQHGQKSCHLRPLDLLCQWMSYTSG